MDVLAKHKRFQDHAGAATLLSTQTAMTTGEDKVLKVIAQDFIRVEKIGIVTPFYRELVELTRKEPLCISHDLFTDQEDPGHFIFIETWPDRADLDLHCGTEHFRRLVSRIDVHQREKATYIMMDAFVPVGQSWQATGA